MNLEGHMDPCMQQLAAGALPIGAGNGAWIGASCGSGAMPGTGISVGTTAGAAAGLGPGAGVGMASRVVTRFVSSFAGTLLLLQPSLLCCKVHAVNDRKIMCVYN